jgi:hypothetical protein
MPTIQKTATAVDGSRRGRPQKIISLDEVLSLAMVGLTDVDIAKQQNVCLSTLRRFLAQEGRRQKIEQVRAATSRTVMHAMFDAAIGGKVASAALVLRSLGRLK